MNALVVIPVYNHSGTLPDVVAGVLAIHPYVLIVDDGSEPPVDPGELKARVVHHTSNKGKGAAILTAAHEAQQNGFTHIVTIDADGQHLPSDLPKLLEAAEQNEQSVILGVRDFESTEVPGSSRFGRSFGNFWVRVQTGEQVGDIQSGYRVYPVDAVLNITCWTHRYSFEVEFVVRALWAGLSVVQVPVSVIYQKGAERISHFHKLKDNARISLINFHLTMRSVVPWPHKKLIAEEETEEKVSVFRPVESIKRLLSQNVTPAGLGGAAAVGVFLGTLPLIACHTICILFASSYLGLNKPAAVAASQLCMPPLVPALCIEVGYYLRHGEWLTIVSWEVLWNQVLERLWEYLLGSLVVAPVLAVLVGGLTMMLAMIISRVTNLDGDSANPASD